MLTLRALIKSDVIIYLFIYLFGEYIESTPSLSPRDCSGLLQAAKLPMSIIIVGVGQAEFDGENETKQSISVARLIASKASEMMIS